MVTVTYAIIYFALVDFIRSLAVADPDLLIRGGEGVGGLGVVIHVCLHVFYLDPEIRGEAGPPGPSPESATVSFLTLA